MGVPRAAGSSTGPVIPHYPLVIDGHRMEAESGRRYDSIDPFQGSAWAAETEMGPLATEPQYRKVVSFFASAASEGATVAAGGHPADSLGGYFVQPTVLTNVKPSMTVACEAVFGPVLTVIPFDTEDEAVSLANDSRYGLAGAVAAMGGCQPAGGTACALLRQTGCCECSWGWSGDGAGAVETGRPSACAACLCVRARPG